MRKKYWRIVAAAVMILCILLRSSVREISAVSDVAGISIDPSEEGGYLFGLEIAETEKENSFTVKSRVLTVKAANLQDALRQAGMENEFELTLTHGSLIVLDDSFLGRGMKDIASIIFKQWDGQMNTVVAVAQDCSAAEVLRSNEGENLRAGLLSAQLRRAERQGVVRESGAFDVFSAILAERETALPVVTLAQNGYRILGSVQINSDGLN